MFGSRLQRRRHGYVHVVNSDYSNAHIVDRRRTTVDRRGRLRSFLLMTQYSSLITDLRGTIAGMLSDFHSLERKCLARKTIWPM
mgnify:CR=1 FL=1